MKEKKVKSVITCDLEGRIQTFNKGAEEIFGYRAEEMIGKKRVSIFSPGEVVLEHVPAWLKAAKERGEFKTRTVFIRRDGSKFAAEIRITPTFNNGVHSGYCGVTQPLLGVSVAEAEPRISLMTKIFSWLVITRAPFLTATIVPVLIGAAWVFASERETMFSWAMFLFTLLGGVALHVAANTFNDYFDWMSGTDQANNDYFLPYTGGSRSIELGLISEEGLRRLAFGALVVASLIGLYLLVVRGPMMLLFGVIGLFSTYYYTAPPLRAVARKGLGELLVGLNFGPLMVAGTVFTITGQLSWVDFLVGVPIGLLTTAILWINEIPDAPSDAETGKTHLVVVLGERAARWGYLALLAAAFGIATGASVLGIFPVGALLMLGGLPLAISAIDILFRHYADRTLIKANATTIQLHMLAGLLLAAGLFWNEAIHRLLGI